MLGSNVHAVDVVEAAVEGLGDYREAGREPGGHQLVAHHADAVGVGQGHGGGQQPRLPDPLEPRHLAVAVEAVAACEDRVASGISTMG
jgi:hypothetical protein